MTRLGHDILCFGVRHIRHAGHGVSLEHDTTGRVSLRRGILRLSRKLSRLSCNLAVCLFIAGIAGSAQADDPAIQDHEARVALVIGNADYPSRALANPVNDVRAMAETLRHLGFKVRIRENASQRDMKRAIVDFGNELSSVRGVGLFYYAGHGLQLNNENFLIPVDANIAKPADVPVETVALQEVLGQMKDAHTRLNIVILDACRNDPFSRRFRGQAGLGLAVVAAPTGTIIAYATAPGEVAADGDGRNGLYTSELINAMALPYLTIEDVFKRVRSNVQKISNFEQVPWENTSLTGEFYFTGPRPPAPPPPPPPIDHEAVFWQSVVKSNNIADFQAYLTAYPNGSFAALTRARIAELEARIPKPEPPKVVVPPTGLLRLHVRPAGATVRVDGAEYGDGPDLVAKLLAGRHTIEVSKAGFGKVTRELVITEGSSADVGLTLDEQRPQVQVTEHVPVAPATGLLRLHVRPPGATVRIDGAEYGDGPDLVAKLTAGRHTIEVGTAGFKDARREIIITEGSSAAVDVALQEQRPQERVQELLPVASSAPARASLPPP